MQLRNKDYDELERMANDADELIGKIDATENLFELILDDEEYMASPISLLIEQLRVKAGDLNEAIAEEMQDRRESSEQALNTNQDYEDAVLGR